MPRIVVGIDGSGHSNRALNWAMTEAAVRNVPLTVLTVCQTIVGVYSGAAIAYPGDATRVEQAQAAAKEETDKALALDEPRPEQVTVSAVAGIPAEELVNASKGADMIVLGSRGTGGFVHLMMGSVSSQVSHHAYCPVVIIPPEDRT